MSTATSNFLTLSFPTGYNEHTDMEVVVGQKSVPTEISIINQSFAWMFAGLVVTGLSSIVVASSPALIDALFSNRILFFGLLLAELGLVSFLSFRINTMSYEAAVASFVGYSFLNGLTLSSIFLLYTATSVASTFFITGAVFGGMAVFGYTTKKDLTAVGSLAFMGLIGVILASIVNIFLHNNGFSYILSYLTIAIFIGLTAYDTQKIKSMSGQANSKNLGVLGALMLYLDFVNIFINLLRIFGRRRS